MGDGEDGPTHEPVEQLLSLRAMHGLVTVRPAGASEVVEAYRTIPTRAATGAPPPTVTCKHWVMTRDRKWRLVSPHDR
jgi:transketolase